jgi:hypothetical protein
MADFRINFFNNLRDSTGHRHHVCQRTIEILEIDDEEPAIAIGISEFEYPENVSHRRGHPVIKYEPLMP